MKHTLEETLMTLSKCIARDCGKQFDTDTPETRADLRSFWMRYCPECRTKGNGTPAIVEIPAFVETTWELRTYDVWGNAKDGYEVNDTRRVGEVTIRCAVERNNADTPSS